MVRPEYVARSATSSACRPMSVPEFRRSMHRKGQRIRDSDSDRIRLFARRTAGAPDSQRRGFFQNFFTCSSGRMRFSNASYTPGYRKNVSPGEQPFEQRLIIRRRLPHRAQEFRAAFVTLCQHVLAHTRGKESLARLVERDSRAFMNKHADLAQLVLGQTDLVPRLWLIVIRLALPASAGVRNYRLPQSACWDGTLGFHCCAGSCFEAARNCESASFSWSDNLTSWLTVATVPRVPCEVWRVMPEIICIA